MSNAYNKKKQPQVVQAQLLEAASHIIVEGGLAGMTLDRVARRAGVSKGGLIHHFPSKQDLVDALFSTELSSFEKICNELITRDSNPHGIFTRAYVTVIVNQYNKPLEGKYLRACGLAMSCDVKLSITWRKWIQDQIIKYGEPIDSTLGRMIRFAAHGVWLEDSSGASTLNLDERKELADYLIKLSHEI